MGRTRKKTNKKSSTVKGKNAITAINDYSSKVVNHNNNKENAIIETDTATKLDEGIAKSDIMNTLLDDTDPKVKDNEVIPRESNAISQVWGEYKKYRKLLKKSSIFMFIMSPFNWGLCRRCGFFRIWVIFVYIFTATAGALIISDWAQGQPSSILESIFKWNDMNSTATRDLKSKAKWILLSLAAFVTVFIALSFAMTFLLSIVIAICRGMLYTIRIIFGCCAGCCLSILGYEPVYNKNKKKIKVE